VHDVCVATTGGVSSAGDVVLSLTYPAYRDEALGSGDEVSRWLRERATFGTAVVGEETFHVAVLPDEIVRDLTSAVEAIVEAPVEMSLLIGRLSTETIDATMRVHTDAGMSCTHACVWYSGDPPEACGGSSGTAFYSHRVWGPTFHGTAAEHDVLLREDAANRDAWIPRAMVTMKRNRLVVYPSSWFHSRYPFRGWGTSQQDGRIVIAGFFKIKECADGEAVDTVGDQEARSVTSESRREGGEDDSGEDVESGGEVGREVRATGSTGEDVKADEEGVRESDG